MEAASRLAEKKLSPLAIVAIFVSLSETVLGILVGITGSFVQLLLAIFAIAFPSGVALAFFLLLTFRPEHFYAPWEYPSVEAMRSFRTEWTTPAVKEEKLIASVKSGVRRVMKDPKDVDEVVREVKLNFVSVDTSPLLGANGYVWNYPYDEIRHVQAFLDSIWVELSKYGIKGRTYGKSWLIRDKDTGTTFSDLGSAYARSHLGQSYDLRSLEEVGITPESFLEVIPANTGVVQSSKKQDS